MPSDKIRTLSHLEDIVADARRLGRTVVFANGCFDLIHLGHVRYLRAARREGDLLVVGLNGDESVRRLKGPDRPYMPAPERAEILAEFRSVDYVVVFEDTTADRLLQRLRPDVHAKGTDYTEDSVPERETVLGYGGRVAIVGDPKRRSSRELLRHLTEE